MAQATGISFEQNRSGIPVTARIDWKKYGSDLLEFFKTKNIEITPPSPYNAQEVNRLLDIEKDMKAGKMHEVDFSNFWNK